MKDIIWWKPEITGKELSFIEEVLNNNFLNEGDFTKEFENKIASLVGCQFAVSTTSGTTALYLSLMALGIGPGDEVIVPDITFIATANAVTMTGAKVVLVDIDPATISMCPYAFERAITLKTRAVIPVHVSGRGGTLLKIIEIANRKNISVIEDAAEALGSKLEGFNLGTYGRTGCFSFSPNKTISTGQGGMIVTNDEKLKCRLHELKDQGRPIRGTGGDDLHPTLGFNFKFTNLQAAAGLGQITALEERINRQKRIYEVYRNELGVCSKIQVFECKIEEGECPQWTDVLAEDRNALVESLEEAKIHCRRFWHPLHTQAPYRDHDTKFPAAMESSGKALWLPSAFQMNDDDVKMVSKKIRDFYG